MATRAFPGRRPSAISLRELDYSLVEGLLESGVERAWRETVSRIASTVGAQEWAVYERDWNCESYVLLLADDNTSIGLDPQISLSEGLIGRDSLLRGQPFEVRLNVPDRNGLVVPAYAAHKGAWGFLLLQFHDRDSQQLAHGLVALRSISGQLAGVFRALRRGQRNETAYRLARQLVEIKSHYSFYQALTRAVTTMINCPFSIWAIDLVSRRCSIQSSRGISQEHEAARINLTDGNSLMYRVVAAREPMQVAVDSGVFSFSHQERLAEQGFRFVAAYPILPDLDLACVISLYSKAGRKFPSSLANPLDNLTKIAAVGLQALEGRTRTRYMLANDLARAYAHDVGDQLEALEGFYLRPQAQRTPQDKAQFKSIVSYLEGRSNLVVDIAKGEQRSSATYLRLGEDVWNAITAVRVLSDASDVNIDVKFQKDHAYYGHRGVLAVAVYNLTKNALEAGCTRIVFTADRRQDAVNVFVRNDGVSIDPHTESNLFLGDSGLGLRASRAVLREAGTDLMLSSTSKGTVFRIVLPATRESYERRLARWAVR